MGQPQLSTRRISLSASTGSVRCTSSAWELTASTDWSANGSSYTRAVSYRTSSTALRGQGTCRAALAGFDIDAHGVAVPDRLRRAHSCRAGPAAAIDDAHAWPNVLEKAASALIDGATSKIGAEPGVARVTVPLESPAEVQVRQRLTRS